MEPPIQPPILKALQPLLNRLNIGTADLAAFVQADRSNFQHMISGRRKMNLRYLIDLAELDVLTDEASRSLPADGPKRTDEIDPGFLAEKLTVVETAISKIAEELLHTENERASAEQRFQLLSKVLQDGTELDAMKTFWLDERLRAAQNKQIQFDPKRMVELKSRLAGLQAERDWLRDKMSNHKN